MNEQPTALVHADDATHAVVQANDNWPGLRKFGAGAYTSLDLNELPDRKLFVAAQQGEQDSLDEYINKEIAVRHVLFHPARREDVQTGEINFWTRLVLILSDGRLISCGSQGILKSLQLATVLFGPPPWPGLRGTVKQQQIAADRRWYYLDWDLEQSPCEIPTPATPKPGENTKSREASRRSG